jgi:hypothetical protein
MRIDIHEPEQMVTLIRPAVQECIVGPFNSNGYADYWWTMHDGVLEQVERKQVTEILSNMAKVEDQLRQHISKHPDGVLWLLIEGVAEPSIMTYTTKSGYEVEAGTMLAYNKSLCHGGRTGSEYHFVPGWESRIPYERWEGWLTGVERAGIRVKRTNDLFGSARVLARMEQSASGPGTTLQRHLKPQTPKHYNPHVMNVLGIGQHREAKSGVDVKMAERLVAKFGSLYDIMRLPPEIIAEEIPGMGLNKAIQFLKACGRTDV